MSKASPIRAAFDEAALVLRAFLDDAACQAAIERFADAAETTFRRGGTIYSCGNGGSMCDAMHFAEEWTGRFRSDRAALPALAFSDPSHMTCIANDFGYEQVFARQIAVFGEPGDLLLVLSGSGKSPNILFALGKARELGVKSWGLFGAWNGLHAMAKLADCCIIFGKDMQEAEDHQLTVGHDVLRWLKANR